MRRFISRDLGRRMRAAVGVVALLGSASGLAYDLGSEPVGAASPAFQESIPNNRPAPNPGGAAATFSTQGFVDLTGEYFQAQGTNGRSCASWRASGGRPEPMRGVTRI